MRQSRFFTAVFPRWRQRAYHPMAESEAHLPSRAPSPIIQPSSAAIKGDAQRSSKALIVAEGEANVNEERDEHAQPLDAPRDLPADRAASQQPRQDTMSEHVLEEQMRAGVPGGPADELFEMSLCGVAPRWMQAFARAPWFLTALCLFTLSHSMASQGFVPVAMSSIETRYGLSSVESGFLVSWHDVTFCCSVLLVTHFGHAAHIPVWLGRAMLALALGCFLFALPQFAGSRYAPTVASEGADVCRDLTSLTALTPSPNASRNDAGACMTSEKGMYGLLMAGQLFVGIAAAPLLSLGVTYIDNNVAPEKNPLYIGIFYMFQAIGPTVGFMLGGVFLTLWVDPGASTTLTEESSGWVGAWWAGFVLSAGLAVLFSPTLFAFPFHLPGTQWIRDQRAIAESASAWASHSSRARASMARTWTSFGADLKSLVTNKPYMCAQLASAAESMVAVSVGTFLPKLIETQFLLPSSDASFFAGVSVTVSTAVGALLGGYISKTWTARENARNAALLAGVSVFCVTAFLIHCAPVNLVGQSSAFARLSSQYVPLNNSSFTSMHSCNTPCECSADTYQPVCAQDTLQTFQSACHAGCQSKVTPSRTYTNCTCASSLNQTLTQGKCRSDCNLLPVFLVLIIIMTFFSFLTEVPATTITLRTVSEHERSLAMGFGCVVYRVLGAIPGPLLVGVILDGSCLLWETRCGGERGACWDYQSDTVSVAVFTFFVIIKCLSSTFFGLAWYFLPPDLSPPNKVSDSGTASNMSSPKDTRGQSASFELLTKSPWVGPDITVGPAMGLASFDEDDEGHHEPSMLF